MSYIKHFNLLNIAFKYNNHEIYLKRKLRLQRLYSTFSNAYVPSIVEANKYNKWEKCQEFTSEQKDELSQQRFSIIMPPPNVTGTLHLGHALTLTIQDILVRWHKMHGVNTMWIPGIDHAGIATQVIVEKIIWNELKKTRFDIGKESFEKQIWKWKKQKYDTIRQQIKLLGVLPNWSNEIFTLDSKRSKAVTEAFIRLFESGRIYRSDYIVNWSCSLQSAISDIEVEHLQISGRTDIPVPGYNKPVPFGVLTKFAYKICETDGELVVATTRPETLFGDVAVAIHPSDTRYSRLKGYHVFHPFRQEPIPIICDESVDRDFGTGVVKVTPSHDPTDFEIAKRHNLKLLQVIDETGIMNENCGSYAGINRFDARSTVVQDLKSMNLLRGTEDHSMTVPICSRSHDVIEFLVKPQWFLDCKDMAKKATMAVQEGKLTINPPVFNKTWFHWLDNIRDWCISRQLWWGHKIPAYLCHTNQDPNNKVWVAAFNLDEAKYKAATKLSTTQDNITAIQEEDVLDTWFSSALLPFSVFGWPNKESNYDRHYPLNMMETGHDILFFWVARMVMLGMELTDQLPFDKIFLHGIICDAHGRKMSKSLGNVVAPEDVITGKSLEALISQIREAVAQGLISGAELNKSISNQEKMYPSGIPECGTDALRFTLCSHNVKSHFINFDINECYTNKLFCNKIWQSCKYTRISAQKLSGEQKMTDVPFDQLHKMDKWILSRLCAMVSEVDNAIGKLDFHVATAALKNFFYNEFCDVYIETTKLGLRVPEMVTAAGHVQTLIQCLEIGLRCLYPIMPFLSEEIYDHIPIHPTVNKSNSIYLSNYPKMDNLQDASLENKVEMSLETISVIRQLMKLYNVPFKSQPKVYIITNLPVFQEFRDVIASLTGCNDLIITSKFELSQNEIVSNTVQSFATVHLELPASIDRKSHSEEMILKKKIDKIMIEIEKLKNMTAADSYKMKAPASVQEKHSAKISSLETEMQRLLKIQSLSRGQKDTTMSN